MPCLSILSCKGKGKPKLPKGWEAKGWEAKGEHQSDQLPVDGREPRPDFARVVSQRVVSQPEDGRDEAGWRPGLYVASYPYDGGDYPVTRVSSLPRRAGDVSNDVAIDVFADFVVMLKDKGSRNMTEGIAERIVCIVAAIEDFMFARKHSVAPQMPQTKFVLILSSNGEVRVLLLAFKTNEVQPGITSTPWILKLMTKDLAHLPVGVDPTTEGVGMEYGIVPANDEVDLDIYVLNQISDDLYTAASVGDARSWNDLLGPI